MLEIGTVLTLKKIDDKEMEHEELYKCRVVDKDTDRLYIDYPVHIETKKSCFFLNGTKFDATFITRRNSVYTFQTEIVGKEIKEIPMLVITDPGREHYTKIQRRRFVRVETIVDVSISREGSKEAFPTIANNISAGGAAIKIPQQMNLKQQERLKILLVLPMRSGEIHYLKLNAEVVRISEKDSNSIAYIQFLETPPSQRQLLLLFSFEKQLLLRKKGLIE